MKLRIMRGIVLVCFFGCLWTSWPLVAQSVKDAVQDEKLQTIEKRVDVLEVATTSMAERQTYTLGGIAGMYALLGIIGLFNIRFFLKK